MAACGVSTCYRRIAAASRKSTTAGCRRSAATMEIPEPSSSLAPITVARCLTRFCLCINDNHTSFPGPKHLLVCGCAERKKCLGDRHFALDGGLSAIASTIRRADLPEPLTPASCERTPGRCDRQTEVGETTCSARPASHWLLCSLIASGALAATKTHSIAPSQDRYTVYNPAGAYVGTDPDLNIRFDWDRGH
jgi:hypothetical protein